MVPPSIVIKVKISIPDAVKVGAVPPAQSTDGGHAVPLFDAPFVKINVKEQHFPVALGLSKV